MRLNKEDKAAFVLAVMDDVPLVDYNEKARVLVQQTCFDALPEALKPLVKQHRNYFTTPYVSTPAGLHGAFCVCPPELQHNLDTERPDVWEQLKKMGELNEAQENARDELKAQVRGLINTCTTLKQAQARLPEFAKYLPAERGESGLTNLPVANTLAELQAAGWPKGE